jgi:hypothetical protein
MKTCGDFDAYLFSSLVRTQTAPLCPWLQWLSTWPRTRVLVAKDTCPRGQACGQGHVSSWPRTRVLVAREVIPWPHNLLGPPWPPRGAKGGGYPRLTSTAVILVATVLGHEDDQDSGHEDDHVEVVHDSTIPPYIMIATAPSRGWGRGGRTQTAPRCPWPQWLSTIPRSSERWIHDSTIPRFHYSTIPRFHDSTIPRFHRSSKDHHHDTPLATAPPVPARPDAPVVPTIPRFRRSSKEARPS